MTDARYPAEWECDVVLADGGTAHLRPLRTDDADQLLAFLTRLSDRSRMLRFFAPVSPQTAYRAARFDEVDYESTFGLVAELGDELIAVGTWQRAEDPTVAEVAFAVADEHQARGIGSILLEHLAAAGRVVGLRRFVASTLAENRRMLRVFHEAGWDVARDHVEGIVELSFPIDDERSREVLYRREHLAEARSVERLLHPHSIAVVGAGRDPEGPGHQVLRNLRDGGFTGALHAVDPAASGSGVIAGVPCVARVVDIGGPVDLAVISVPEIELDTVIADCAAKHVHGLVVLTAVDGDATARDAVAHHLAESARHLGMRVLGPECLGIVNTDPEIALQATVGPVQPRRGRIGWCSQSGAIGLDLLARATDAGLGVSTFVSLGDKADVSGNDLLQYWDSDPDTDVVLLYLESFGNPRKFARVARRVSARKPIIAIKSARSAAGSRGAAVRALLRDDPDAAVDALLNQAGVVRVTTLEDMLVTAAVFERCPLPSGDRVAIVGNAVGPAVVAADACVAAGLTVPEGGAGFAVNPVHLRSTVSPQKYADALGRLLADGGVDAVLAVVVPMPGHDAAALRQVIGSAAASTDKPVVACILGQPALVGHAGPVPTFAFAEHAAAALGRAAAYARGRDRPRGVVPELNCIDIVGARGVVRDFLTAKPPGGALDPDAAAALLATVGIAVDPHSLPSDDGTLTTTVEVENDEAFGPLVTFAITAGHPDVLHDASVAVAPLTDLDARDLVRAPRTSPLLLGNGDAAALDTDGLEDLILRVARLADEIPELARLVLDPVAVATTSVIPERVSVMLAPVTARVPTDVRRMRDR